MKLVSWLDTILLSFESLVKLDEELIEESNQNEAYFHHFAACAVR